MTPRKRRQRKKKRAKLLAGKVARAEAMLKGPSTGVYEWGVATAKLMVNKK